MSRSDVKTSQDVVVQLQGAVPVDVARYAQDKMMSIVRKSGEPVLYARVRLTQGADPAVSRPAVAQANLDVNGRQLRAQVAAKTLHEAIDLLQARLRERHARLDRDRAGASRGTLARGVAAGWRHGDEPTDRPDLLAEPAADRTIVRRKSVAPARETPAEAAVEMAAMGYDFHLFVDAETGQDSVVERAEPGGYRLTRTEPPASGAGPVEPSFAVTGHPAPRLGEAEAVDRLELTGSAFVFFVAKATGRGTVLYRRYDGHYGLINPPG
jgi:Sigma 54 modulation/S30EA ribosomal protein C terminus